MFIVSLPNKPNDNDRTRNLCISYYGYCAIPGIKNTTINGHNVSQVQHEDAIASVEYYDAVENAWTRAPDMGNARAWAAVGAVM